MTGPDHPGGDAAADAGTDVDDARTAELRAALAAVESRVAAACRDAERPRADVRLVVVTKTYPADDVRRLARLGVRDVGESRDQEAAAKAALLAPPAGPRLRWHFVGQLQRGKVRSVAGYCDVVHSVDRQRLLGPLGRAALEHGRVLDVLVQVDVGGTAQVAGAPRGGCDPADVPQLAAAAAATDGLRLRGLMAVAPRGEPARPAFERLAALAGAVRADHPGATWLSAGMSGDLEDAVAAGATHLRVGSAVLGARPPLR